MSSPDISVLPNTIYWFAPFKPKELEAPCSHGCTHHRIVVAWGPTEELYELLECRKCGCRAWRPWFNTVDPLDWRNTVDP